ncbi:MAG: carbon storage regulator CsrA [Patescibacteria group bacterium]
MLTLTRKVGEIIRIGDDIQIVVKEIRRNHVRIGILAPREVKIYREEVYQNVQAEAAENGIESDSKGSSLPRTAPAATPA